MIVSTNNILVYGCKWWLSARGLLIYYRKYPLERELHASGIGKSTWFKRNFKRARCNSIRICLFNKRVTFRDFLTLPLSAQEMLQLTADRMYQLRPERSLTMLRGWLSSADTTGMSAIAKEL
jgi:hypothetical protein